MRRADIRDVHLIAEAVKDTTGQDVFLGIKGDIKSNYWYTRDKFVVQYKFVAKDLYIVHLFGTPLKSLKKTRDFIKEAGEHLCSQVPCSILALKPKGDRRLGFLLNSLSSKGILELPNGDLLYTFSKEEV